LVNPKFVGPLDLLGRSIWGLTGGLDTSAGWALVRWEVNSGYMRDIPDENGKYETIGIKVKPSLSRVRIMYPEFRTVFSFVRKYEFDREKVEIGAERNGIYPVRFQP
jgi:hypothetical protein